MGLLELKEKFDIFLYRAYNLAVDISFLINYKLRKRISSNKSIKNIHKNGRCFILGTGPSLLNLTSIQIEKLNCEILFGVNSLYKSNLGSRLRPTYYTLMDNVYWNEWADVFQNVSDVYKKFPPRFITDIRAESVLDVSEFMQPIFVYAKKYPVGTVDYELHKGISGVMNVVSYSLQVALYMGFSEIYLLGCDYNVFCNINKFHCYDDKDELNQFKYNLAYYLKFYSMMTEFHYLLRQMADSMGVEIINLTPNSLLDSYEKKDIGEVLGV